MAGGQKGVWIGLAGVVLVGLVAVMGLRTLAPPAAPEPPGAAGAEAPTAPAASVPPDGATPMQAQLDARPPWVEEHAATAPPGANALEQARDQADTAARQSRDALEELRARSAANEAGIRASIARLDELQASQAARSGVNLDALRGNLEVALRMQRITQEVQALSLQPAGEARTAAMRAKVDELNQLQGQLRYDIAAPAAATGSGGE